MNLKNRREAILEFLRIKLSDKNQLEPQSQLEKDVLANLAQQIDAVEEIKDFNLKEIEPYNEADMYTKHCDMLV